MSSETPAADQLRAAAERILMEWFHEDEPSPFDESLEPEPANQIRDDAMGVARAVLGLLPTEDADEPVTETWLIQQGFAPHGEDNAILRRGSISVVVYPAGDNPNDVSNYWRVDDQRLPDRLWPKTRGHFRNLMAALGVTTNGG
ncbi:hypothetical protein [Fimbriiglobus ruber]|uniref:Uncharacterized protein n=1 Tax=Fimbriiglobus ruber TaxID=1908690 RepID=A0A225DDZ4_9BACT|nr:hypothetical protein [Fimbriiglobus ruber]OWK34347.1 hypothetical protein FRUB_10318 [Fimbriiglobus ruber]